MKFFDKMRNSKYVDISNPIDPDNPSGIDIEYDHRFIELQQMTEGVAEQQYGDTIIAGTEPDWKKVLKLTTQLSMESKNVYVMCYYIQALSAVHGIEGFYYGCKMLSYNMEHYWSSIYPSLYDQGDFDPLQRLNAVSQLNDKEGVLKNLYKCKVCFSNDSRLEISIKDAIDTLTFDTKSGSYPGGVDQLITDINVSWQKKQSHIVAIIESLKLIKNIEKTFLENLPDEVLDLSKIKSALSVFEACLDLSVNSTNGHEMSSVEAGQNKTSDSLTTMNYDTSSIKINNRHDVEDLLNKICLYFATHEPSHPAPLFLKRAIRTLDMNFYEIIEDITPNSLEEVDGLFGKLFKEKADLND